jgi:mannose-1-phosphate guanylyltransferase
VIRVYGVILAGGKGKRFWPFSRSSRPKQFLDVTGEGSMLSLTYHRLARFIPERDIILLTLEELIGLVKEELPRLSTENIFAEPVGRNTAPSIAVASLLVRRRGADEPFVVCPADHTIAKDDEFERLVRSATEVARRRDVLVTFGIIPEYPATGYGYIEAGAEVDAGGGASFYEAKRFHEKPDAETAAAYCSAGGFYWNSGMFVLRPSVYLRAWSRCLPAGEAPLRALEEALALGDIDRVARREYPKMPAISVDYGILEKSDNVVVVPADIGWSDVGSWDSIADLLPADAQGNVCSGEAVTVDTRNSIFFNPGGVSAAVGVDDIIVVVDGTTVLVCRRGESQRVREITDRLEQSGRNELL